MASKSPVSEAPLVSTRVNSEHLKLTEGEKKKLLVCILVSEMMCGTMILNVASFYPLHVEKHYSDNISSAMVASALSCF